MGRADGGRWLVRCSNHGGGDGGLRRTVTRQGWRVSTMHWNGRPLHENRRIRCCPLNELSICCSLPSEHASPKRSRSFEFMRVGDVWCAGPSCARDGARRAPKDGSSASGAPNIRHPHAICSRPAKFLTDEQRARRAQTLSIQPYGSLESRQTAHPTTRSRGARHGSNR